MAGDGAGPLESARNSSVRSAFLSGQDVRVRIPAPSGFDNVRAWLEQRRKGITVVGFSGLGRPGVAEKIAGI